MTVPHIDNRADPLPLSVLYPEHDLLERALRLIAQVDTLDPRWVDDAAWWRDQYNRWKDRTGLLNTLSAAAFHQAALIAKCQVTVGEVGRLIDDCLEAGATEQQVRKVVDDAQAEYEAKNPGVAK